MRDEYEEVYYDHISIDAKEAEEIERHLNAGEVQCVGCGDWFLPDPDDFDEDWVCRRCQNG